MIICTLTLTLRKSKLKYVKYKTMRTDRISLFLRKSDFPANNLDKPNNPFPQHEKVESNEQTQNSPTVSHQIIH